MNSIDLEATIIEKDKSASIRYGQSPNLDEYLNSIK